MAASRMSTGFFLPSNAILYTSSAFATVDRTLFRCTDPKKRRRRAPLRDTPSIRRGILGRESPHALRSIAGEDGSDWSYGCRLLGPIADGVLAAAFVLTSGMERSKCEKQATHFAEKPLREERSQSADTLPAKRRNGRSSRVRAFSN